MVTLPREFAATKFPGYFWNTLTHELFSLKVGGVLRKMNSYQVPGHFNKLIEPAYRVSHKGRGRWLMASYLDKLTLVDVEIPYLSGNKS